MPHQNANKSYSDLLAGDYRKAAILYNSLGGYNFNHIYLNTHWWPSNYCYVDLLPYTKA